MFDPQRIHIYTAKITNGEFSCLIRVETYWADEKYRNRAAWFFAYDSTFPVHYGLPEDFRTKMRLSNDCQILIPREYMNGVLPWIEMNLENAYGPNCTIEATYKRKP